MPVFHFIIYVTYNDPKMVLNDIRKPRHIEITFGHCFYLLLGYSVVDSFHSAVVTARFTLVTASSKLFRRGTNWG